MKATLAVITLMLAATMAAAQAPAPAASPSPISPDVVTNRIDQEVTPAPDAAHFSYILLPFKRGPGVPTSRPYSRRSTTSTSAGFSREAMSASSTHLKSYPRMSRLPTFS